MKHLKIGSYVSLIGVLCLACCGGGDSERMDGNGFTLQTSGDIVSSCQSQEWLEENSFITKSRTDGWKILHLFAKDRAVKWGKGATLSEWSDRNIMTDYTWQKSLTSGDCSVDLIPTGVASQTAQYFVIEAQERNRALPRIRLRHKATGELYCTGNGHNHFSANCNFQ